MIRKIIQIDEEKCDGCGICANACHEGAIGIVDGKARLLRDDFCDGMGDCLPACPQGAISFVEREAQAYNEAAVVASQMAKAKADAHASMPANFACPGSQARTFGRGADAASAPGSANLAADEKAPCSRLSQWPCQIKLVPPNAPYFQGCDLLIAADCTAFARADFHERFIAGRIALIGCPKLDGVDYAEKLGLILAENDVKSVLVTRMEVPCCGGLEAAVHRAIEASGKDIPCQVVTIGVEGGLL